jgi:O-antigen/teichoic acid export membrane protein
MHLLWRFSLPAAASGLVMTGMLWLGNSILIRSPQGYSDLGTLRMVDQLRTLVLFLPAMVLSPTYPVMANSAGAERRDRLITYMFVVTTLLVLPLAVGVVAVGRDILWLLYGSTQGAIGPLGMTMAVAGLQSLCTGLGIAIAAMGRMWLGFWTNVLWALVFVSAAFFSIPIYGPVGYLGSLALAYAALLAIQFLILRTAGFRVLSLPRLMTVLAFFVFALLAALWMEPRLGGLLSAAGAVCASALLGVALLVVCGKGGLLRPTA